MKSDSLRQNPKWIAWMACTGFMAFSPFAATAAGSVSEVQAVQQQQTIKGIVVDATGEGVIGASVVVEGTTIGVIFFYWV